MRDNYLCGIFGNTKEVAVIEYILNIDNDLDFYPEDVSIAENISSQSVANVLRHLYKLRLVTRERDENEHYVYSKTDNQFWSRLKETMAVLYNNCLNKESA